MKFRFRLRLRCEISTAAISFSSALRSKVLGALTLNKSILIGGGEGMILFSSPVRRSLLALVPTKPYAFLYVLSDIHKYFSRSPKHRGGGFGGIGLFGWRTEFIGQEEFHLAAIRDFQAQSNDALSRTWMRMCGRTASGSDSANNSTPARLGGSGPRTPL